ncbi:hypothetical protein A2U01_0034139, partial [Trifolium medium]|nr:hypothetical protein [Trifolium medium]
RFSPIATIGNRSTKIHSAAVETTEIPPWHQRSGNWKLGRQLCLTAVETGIHLLRGLVESSKGTEPRGATATDVAARVPMTASAFKRT